MDPLLLSPPEPSVPVALALSEGDVSQQVLGTKREGSEQRASPLGRPDLGVLTVS